MIKQIFMLPLILLFCFSSIAQQYEIINKTSKKHQDQRVLKRDNFKCSVDSTKLGLLKQYITCQSSPLLGACGTLGAFVAGRTVTKKILERLTANLEKQKSEFIDELAQQLHRDIPRELSSKDEVLKRHREVYSYYEGLQEGTSNRLTRVSELLEAKDYSLDEFDDITRLTKSSLSEDDLKTLRTFEDKMPLSENEKNVIRKFLGQAKEKLSARVSFGARALEEYKLTIENLKKSTGPFYKPQLATDFKYMYDVANQDYKDLPDAGKVEYKSEARVVYDEILIRIKEGKPLNDEFVHRASVTLQKNKLPSSIRPLYAELPQEKVEKYIATVRKGLNQFMSSTVKDAEGPLVKHLAGQLAKTGAITTTRTIGFLVSGGSLVAEVAFLGLTYSPSTGCSSLTDSYLNAQGSDCEPKVGISNGVLHFLDLPRDQQEQFLNINKDHGKFCKFYEDLYDQTFNQSVQSVSCMGRSIEVNMYDTTYGQYSSHIHFREDGTIEKIGSILGKGSILHQIDQEAKDVRVTGVLLEDKDAPFVARTIQANKLYAQEIASCCQSEPTEQQKCLYQFNTSKTQRMIDDSQSKGVR